MPDMGDTLSEIRADGFDVAAKFPASGSPAEIMAQAAAGMGEALNLLKPEAIVILGDRCEMLGAASAALLCGIPVVHIAGGTVSEGAFDDSIRHAITKIATLHFPETRQCAARILQMGEDPESVFTAGALGVENALKVKRLSASQLRESLNWDPGKDFLLCTLHAATLEHSRPLDVQNTFLNALKSLDGQLRFLLTYPNSDTDSAPLIASLHEFERSMGGRAKVVPSLGRVRYLSAAALSRGVAGNSSSGLVEVPSLRVPTLDIGLRQQGRECGASVTHCGTKPDEMFRGLRLLLSPEMRKLAEDSPNPYYAPDTSAMIANRILSTTFTPYPSKKFHTL